MPVLPTAGNAVHAVRLLMNARVVPDLGDESLIVIHRLEALLGSMAVWEIEDDVGLPARSPTGRRWAPCRPWQAWCG